MEAQTQKNSITKRWQIIGVCIGMIIGFVYPSIGLALGMLIGIVFGILILVEIPLNTPQAQRAQQKSEIFFLLILSYFDTKKILGLNHRIDNIYFFILIYYFLKFFYLNIF